mgnify:FL=1
MTIEIIDDALAPMEMAAIEGHLMGQDILWNWNENIVAEEQRECEKKYDQQMTHLFYMNPTFLSPDYRCLEPLFYKLNASVMIRVKANLTFCTEKNILTGWHTDVIESWGKEHKTKTAIYYVNSTNGYTMIRDDDGVETKVEGNKNRLVIFPSHFKHAGVTCTSPRKRVVVNINYL